MEISSERRRAVRSRFPALSSDAVFLENAGGSQVPVDVIDRMGSYLTERYVQLGAGYERSRLATALVDEAHAFVELLMNARDGRVILGSSTTSLLHMLSGCLADRLEPGRNEIVVAESAHEANVTPWKALAARGLAEIRWWKLDPGSHRCELDALAPLLSERTALVTVPHVSNLLGEIVDVDAVTAMAHGVGARVVVDGVAFAPHRAMDVGSADWYAFSTYKVYGPHMAALYGRADAMAELQGPNHFFIPDDAIPYKFELGGANHEACAGMLGVRDYLLWLAGKDPGAVLSRGDVERAFDTMTACELPLQATLVEYLKSKPGVRLVGPAHGERSRVGTIGFVHATKSSREITEGVDHSTIAIRHGHMYAYHLCEALGLDPEDGVVRVSLVHYNTPEEIHHLIEVLEPLI